MLQAHVRQAIDAIRGDTSRYEQYAADPRVLAVLQVHGTARACAAAATAAVARAEGGWCCYYSSHSPCINPHQLCLCLVLPVQKMRRLHGVAQANGQRTVSLEDMAAQVGRCGGLGWVGLGWVGWGLYRSVDGADEELIDQLCPLHAVSAWCTRALF